MNGDLVRQFLREGFDLDKYEVSEATLALVPREVAFRYKIIPLAHDDETIVIAAANVGSGEEDLFQATTEVKKLIGRKVKIIFVPMQQIIAAMEKYYGGGFEESPHSQPGVEETEATEALVSVSDPDRPVDVVDDLVSLDDFEPEPFEDSEVTEEEIGGSQVAPVIRLVNLILVDAVKRGASSIHVETYEHDFRVRYRIDQQLYEVMRPPLKMRNLIIARLKIMADLDVAKHGVPQKGRIELKMGKFKKVDFNVAIIPTAHGEKVVIRILDKDNMQRQLEELGFEDKQFADLQQAVSRPSGLVLVTGPVGSGRFTALRAILNHLNNANKNIFTIEDPISLDMPGVNQLQLKPEAGLGLGEVLRLLDPQDVDVLMVGESPWDSKNMEALVKSALSGRLVLSSFQSEDSTSAVGRLLDMGISPFMLTSSLSLVCAQRLARRICKDCGEDDTVPTSGLVTVGFTSSDLITLKPKKGRGCRTCGNTGFRGFVGIQEVLPLSDEIKKAILQGSSPAQLRQKAVELGMITLRQAGLAKVREGLTTIAEVLRVTPAD